MISIRVLQIIFGLAMLVLGRRLFWVFVGSMGFITATEFAVTSLAGQPAWAVVLIGLAAGVSGALLAMFFQAGAIALAGMLGGGYLGASLTRSVQLTDQIGQAIAYVIGAVLGLAAFLVFFDGAIIAISSFAGSYIVVQQLALTQELFWLVFVVVALIGIGVQLKQLDENSTVKTVNA